MPRRDRCGALAGRAGHRVNVPVGRVHFTLKRSTAVSEIEIRDSDRQVWEEELDAFVPPRVFDAHCHLVDVSHVPQQTLEGRGPAFANSTDLPRMRAVAQLLYPGRQYGFLTLGSPWLGIDVAAHVRFHAEQVRGQSDAVASRLVTPMCRVDDIRRDITEHAFVGLKPYRVFSVTGDRNQCRIHEFLTHEQMELADELGLWVTMHLSRHQGCADAHNLADLAEYTANRYPRIRWILAHCARSFTYRPIELAVDRLRDMPNIWYDVSAVNDVRPLATLFRRERAERILFGSDLFNATSFHGKYVPFGRAWFQVETDRIPNLRFDHCDGRPILAIYEQLLCMKHAAEWAGLSRADIEAIFWHNAASLFPQVTGAASSGDQAQSH